MKLSELLDSRKTKVINESIDTTINIKTVAGWIETFSKTAVTEINEQRKTITINSPKFTATSIRKELNEAGVKVIWIGGDLYEFKFDKKKFENIEGVVNHINESDNPCWKGYEMVGMKKKNGKEVPNCVTVEQVTEEKSNVVKISVDKTPIWIEKIDSSHVKIFNSEQNYEDGKGSSWHIRQLTDNPYHNDLVRWLRKDDFSSINGKSYGDVKKKMKESTSHNKFIQHLQKNIDAPFVAISESKGDLLIDISLDPIKSNSYKTSRYMKFSLSKDGILEQYDSSYKLKDYFKLNRTSVSTASEVSTIINDIANNVLDETSRKFPKGASVVVNNANKYNSLSKSKVEGLVEGITPEGDVIVLTPLFEYVVEQSDVELVESCGCSLVEGVGSGIMTLGPEIKLNKEMKRRMTLSVPTKSKTAKHFSKQKIEKIELGGLTTFTFMVSSSKIDSFVDDMKSKGIEVFELNELSELNQDLYKIVNEYHNN